MYDDVFVVRNCGKLSAKFLLGTPTIIKKAGLLWYLYFLLEQQLQFSIIAENCFDFGDSLR